MILFKAKTKYNNLKVVRKGDVITLFSEDDVKQSAIDIGNPFLPCLEYARSMILSLALHSSPKSILMLGLGGGTIAMMLYHIYEDAYIDVIEIDEEMPKIARKFFHFITDFRMRVVIEDACLYIQNSTKKYDIIILDTYLGEDQPKSMTTLTCYKTIRDLLLPDGIFVANLTTGFNSHFDAKMEQIGSAFPYIWLLPAERKNNMLVFASRKKRSKLKIIRNATLEQSKVPFDLSLIKLTKNIRQYER